MSEDFDFGVVTKEKPIKRGHLGHKTRRGKLLGRPKKPLNELSLRPRKGREFEVAPVRKHRIKDDDLVRRTILGLAKMGKTYDEIADIVGVSRSHLEKNYKMEIKTGKAQANALVVENLYQQAMKDSPSAVPAAMFLAKARMGWSDKDREENARPSVVFDFSGLSYEEKMEMIERLENKKNNMKVIEGEVITDVE